MKVKCDRYEWAFDELTGRLTCSRDGFPWRDETGDKAIYSLLSVTCTMALELTQKHEAEVAKLRAYIERLEEAATDPDKDIDDVWAVIHESEALGI